MTLLRASRSPYCVASQRYRSPLLRSVTLSVEFAEGSRLLRLEGPGRVRMPLSALIACDERCAGDIAGDETQEVENRKANRDSSVSIIVECSRLSTKCNIYS